MLTSGLKNKAFKKEQLREAFTDPYSLSLFLMAFFQTMVVGGINTFAPLLLNKAFGFGVLESQLLNIPMGVMTVLMYFLISFVITKTNQTLYTMVAFTIPNIIGTIVLLTVAPQAKTRGGLVVAFYAMQEFQSVNPAIFLMLSRNSAGQTKKSVTYAITYIGEFLLHTVCWTGADPQGWAGGNALASQLFQSVWAPRYLNSLYIHLGLCEYLLRLVQKSKANPSDSIFIITVLSTRVLLVRRNRSKQAAQGEGKPTNALAFEDLTDIENPDFRYSL